MQANGHAELIAQYRGRAGTIEARPGLVVNVLVTDAKRVYGHVRLLVQPIAGEGEAWMNVDAVTVAELVTGIDARD